LLIELSKQLEDSPLIDAPLDDEIPAQNSSNKLWSRLFSQTNQQQPLTSHVPKESKANGGATVPVASKSQSTNNPWLDLFADLDPLANPQAFDLKMSGGRSVAEQT